MSLLSAGRPLVFRRGRRFAPIAMLCAALLLLGAADASAAIRYAAPGGNEEAGSECLQAHPCSLFNAASRFAENTKLKENDEVIIEPGTYSDAAGELGPDGSIAFGRNINLHGVAGQPRPVISLSEGNGGSAFDLGLPGDVLSDVEILSTGAKFGFGLESGTVDGVVVRAGGSDACLQKGGVLRNSACISNGSGDDALLVITPFATSTPPKLRNVTAIATGVDSRGLRVQAFGNADLTVDAVGVLVRGSAEDVFASTETGARAAVNLDHSDFAEVESKIFAGGGTVTITPPGSSAAADITAEPLLAADGFHELPGSRTIDAGAVAVDGSSGTTDVDGNQRVIGLADIGADEFQIPTTASVSCSPGSVVLAAGSTTCTATVTSTGAAPQGTVKLATDGPGAFADSASCSLTPTGTGQASCHLVYTPSAVGSGTHRLRALYGGDAVHGASEGSTSVQVGAARVTVPNTTLKKKPARKTASRQATFTFVSDQAHSRFECKLDKRAFKPCRSPFKAKKLKPGHHSFQVRAVDVAGVADPTPAVFRWKVS